MFSAPLSVLKFSWAGTVVLKCWTGRHCWAFLGNVHREQLQPVSKGSHRNAFNSKHAFKFSSNIVISSFLTQSKTDMGHSAW